MIVEGNQKENQYGTLTLRVRCLPHQRSTGSTLLADVGFWEEEAGPLDHRS
jgi:hypothetical protein